MVSDLSDASTISQTGHRNGRDRRTSIVRYQPSLDCERRGVEVLDPQWLARYDVFNEYTNGRHSDDSSFQHRLCPQFAWAHEPERLITAVLGNGNDNERSTHTSQCSDQLFEAEETPRVSTAGCVSISYASPTRVVVEAELTLSSKPGRINPVFTEVGDLSFALDTSYLSNLVSSTRSRRKGSVASSVQPTDRSPMPDRSAYTLPPTTYERRAPKVETSHGTNLSTSNVATVESDNWDAFGLDEDEVTVFEEMCAAFQQEQDAQILRSDVEVEMLEIEGSGLFEKSTPAQKSKRSSKATKPEKRFKGMSKRRMKIHKWLDKLDIPTESHPISPSLENDLYSAFSANALASCAEELDAISRMNWESQLVTAMAKPGPCWIDGITV